MELSEERKKQIRAEEEARLRAEQEAEQRYREQIRKELEGQQPLKIDRRSSDKTPAEPDAPPIPDVPRRHRLPLLRRAIAGALVLVGLACVGLAFSQGFALPFMGPPGQITLKAAAAGELEAVGEAAPGEPYDTSPTSHSSTPRAKDSGATTPARSSISALRRASLQGTGVSIEVPAGWVVEAGDHPDVLEIRWRGSGVVSGHDETAAYVLLQREDLQSGETLEGFAERLIEQFASSTTTEDRVRIENDRVIPNFHGVKALSIDIISNGYLPCRMRNLYWVKDGRGYFLTCYGSAGTFEDRLPAFNRMLDSIRLSSEGRG